jgi:predicted kinase
MAQSSSSKQILIMVGFPGSGKTTWAEEQEGYIRIDGDSLKTPEKMIRVAAAALVLDNCEKGVIFDSTGGTVERRAKFIQFAKDYNLPYRVIWVAAPIEDSMARNKSRPLHKQVPGVAFYVYRKKFEEPTLIEGPITIVD